MHILRLNISVYIVLYIFIKKIQVTVILLLAINKLTSAQWSLLSYKSKNKDIRKKKIA